MTVDRAFIASILQRFEGRGIPTGYVPCDREGAPLGASGVTIATGLDLGQHSRASLERMGVPAELVDRFVPYLGLTRYEALNRLREQPLALTPGEVEAVDQAVHAAYVASAGALFGKAAFAAAPREVQAVAVSLHYQFGTPARKASPALAAAWSALQEGAYRRAADLLEDTRGWSASHQLYMKRRRAEAALLREAGRA